MSKRIESIIWSSDKQRVFVAPAYGCSANCVFCYLMGHNIHEPKYPLVEPEILAESILSSTNFKEGVNGTLISLGCLSEPLATHALDSTLRFLQALDKLPNPIQLASRWVLPDTSFKLLAHVARKPNIIMFHSLSTIYLHDQVEIGTPILADRQQFIKQCVREGISSVLYIKPFLPCLTKLSTKDLIKFALDTGLTYAVVGPLYIDDQIRSSLSTVLPLGWETSYFGQTKAIVWGNPGKDFGYSYSERQDVVFAFQNAGLRVFSHSCEVARLLTTEVKNAD